jgi:predicted AAA+ superfamily ATPase
MLKRRALAAVQAALTRQAAVALLGPRQVGKTTLALAIADSVDALYLDLEAPEDRAKLQDPVLFLRAYEDRLISHALDIPFPGRVDFPAVVKA